MNREPPDVTELLTLDQLIERVPWLTKRWVRELVATGRLPRRKAGTARNAKLLFRLDEVAALVEESYGGTDATAPLMKSEAPPGGAGRASPS